MKRWFLRTTGEERAWEKKHILSLMDKYLSTDVLQKVQRDEGYRTKVDLLESKVGKCAGYVLDIGSNTAGECEYMTSRGYNFIATDINEHALAISKKRCAHYHRKAPDYVACDGAKLPFLNESIECVVFNESLHHMPDPLLSIREAWRVLVPGGKILLFEPYAYDPWRRISEIRDYFRGTIETSFSESQIRGFLNSAGFQSINILRPVLPPSTYKLEALPAYHRYLRKAYFRVRSSAPGLLGMILCESTKAGQLFTDNISQSIDSILICPITSHRLIKTSMGYASSSGSDAYVYPTLDGIPVLIAEDAISSRIVTECS